MKFIVKTLSRKAVLSVSLTALVTFAVLSGEAHVVNPSIATVSLADSTKMKGKMDQSKMGKDKMSKDKMAKSKMGEDKMGKGKMSKEKSKM